MTTREQEDDAYVRVLEKTTAQLRADEAATETNE